jgi:hypothetical protein
MSSRLSAWIVGIILAVMLAGGAQAADGPISAARRADLQAATQQYGETSNQALAAEIALANALITEDNLAEGVERLKHIRAVVVAQSGEDAPEALLISASVSMALSNGGDAVAGEAMARDAVDRAQRTRGDNDIVTGLAKAGLGAALAMQGHYAEAYPMLQAGYQGMGAMFGPDALQTRQVGTYLQNVTAALGYDAEALALRRRLAAAPPPGSPEPLVLLAAQQQLLLLNAEQRYGEAQALGEALVARLSTLRGAGHTTTLEAMSALASADSGQGRIDPAADLQQQVYDGYVKVRGADDLMSVRHGDLLGLYLSRSHDPARRARGRAQLERVIEQRRRLEGPHAAQVVLDEVWLGTSALNEEDGDPTKAMGTAFRWLLEADRDLATDLRQKDSQTAVAVNTLIGTQLINQGEGKAAYMRLSHAASVIQARYADRRVATSGLDAMQELTSHRYIFTNQVRAGWLYAHEP